jgi:hypothetical protein
MWAAPVIRPWVRSLLSPPRADTLLAVGTFQFHLTSPP